MQLAPDLDDIRDGVDKLIMAIVHTMEPTETMIDAIATIESALFVHDITHTKCVCERGQLAVPCPVCDPVMDAYLKRNQLRIW